MITDVAITVDVEFSIGGAFADPASRRPLGPEVVECRVDGEAAGLGFILDTLERHGLRGVCFVEAMNACYFGDEPMGAIARSIRARGHDVQLHLHPCWTAFAHPDWPERVRAANPVDSMADLSGEEIDEALAAARATFVRWGMPEPRAFRAGNLQVDRRIYAALARQGIQLASNLGVGIHRPADPALQLNAGRHWVDGVMEVPVTSYRDLRVGGWAHWKAFTVIGTGAREAEELLDAVARSGAGPVVVLTHPTEFVTHGADGTASMRRNPLARERLERLCGFLAARPERFRVVTFGESVEAWTAGGPTANPELSVSWTAAAMRFVENRRSDERAPR